MGQLYNVGLFGCEINKWEETRPTSVVARDENGRERSGKPYNHFRYHIFYAGTGTGTGMPVGKMKSGLRDSENDTFRSVTCR